VANVSTTTQHSINSKTAALWAVSMSRTSPTLIRRPRRSGIGIGIDRAEAASRQGDQICSRTLVGRCVTTDP